jgi:hypothetical protein
MQHLDAGGLTAASFASSSFLDIARPDGRKSDHVDSNGRLQPGCVYPAAFLEFPFSSSSSSSSQPFMQSQQEQEQLLSMKVAGEDPPVGYAEQLAAFKLDAPSAAAAGVR